VIVITGSRIRGISPEKPTTAVGFQNGDDSLYEAAHVMLTRPLKGCTA
jgi:hypothetical protein